MPAAFLAGGQLRKADPSSCWPRSGTTFVAVIFLRTAQVSSPFSAQTRMSGVDLDAAKFAREHWRQLPACAKPRSQHPRGAAGCVREISNGAERRCWSRRMGACWERSAYNIVKGGMKSVSTIFVLWGFAP